MALVFAEEYSDHPNEVVKNEELTYNRARSQWAHGPCLALALTASMMILGHLLLTR